MENRSYDDIIGNPRAPYINELAAGGALFTQSYAVAHPSQPNYLALFSGSTQGIHDDSCPHTFDGPNLGRSLVDAGRSFVGLLRGPAVARVTGLQRRARTPASTRRG